MAAISPATSPRQIERTDLMREISITANISGRSSGEVFADVDKVLKQLKLPPGVVLSQQGERQDMQESLGYAVQALAMALYAVFVTYRMMGKNYDAAVLAAGHCGFGLGATPTAIANMQAITDRFGPSHMALLLGDHLYYRFCDVPDCGN